MRRTLSLLLSLFLVIGLLATPSASWAGKRKNPDVVEDALAYAQTDRAKAILLLEDALASGPSARDLDPITLHAGEQRRLASDYDAAHAWFNQILSRGGKSPDAAAAGLGVALIQAASAIDARTLDILAEVAERDALETQNADRYLVLATDAARRDDSVAVGQYSRKALAYAKEDPAVDDRVKATLADLAQQVPAEGAIAAAAPLATTSNFERAEKALAAGKKEEARKLATKARDAAAPGTPAHRAASYLLRRVDGAAVSAQKIGVLLPLTGKYEAVARQFRDALEFGFRAEAGNRTLQFIDSGGTPETAVAALETAVIDGGVIAVVGPVLTDETDAVVEAAEALHVPLISLSQSLTETDDLVWVVQPMMTARDQIAALLDEVMGKEGMTSFAVFAPQNAYGENATALFEELVVARGGKVAAIEFYDPKANEMLANAKTLGRKDYSARSREFYDLKKEAAEKGGNPDRVVLPPTLDFQALFLPDNASRVPLACAALAYEEFPMGDFQPTKDSPVIPLLGLSGWNNHGLVGTGGPYARRSYFTDAFLLPAPVDDPPWLPSPGVQSFIERYRAATKRTPTPLEAITADIGSLLARAAKGDIRSRAQLRDALFEASLEGAVTGLRGIDPETHRATRDMLILTVTKDGIIPRSELAPATAP